MLGTLTEVKMRKYSMAAGLVLASLVSGCAADTVPTSSVSVDVTPRLASGSQVVTQVVGSGHVMRNLGAGDELTTFSYSALGRADGSASGQFQYNFRAADFSMHGTVSCVSIAGNQGWVGGNITQIHSGDPADQALVGTEVWWRVIDNGQGAGALPDQTTSLLLARRGGTITSESWCRDQPPLAPARDVLHGNIQVK